jgi:hypothetical protein
MIKHSIVINQFLLLWSLVSPACFVLVASILRMMKIGWYPGYPQSMISIAIYLVYWLLLGGVQAGLLFWFYHYRKLAIQWFIVTVLTGMGLMLVHDFCVKWAGVDIFLFRAIILAQSLLVLALLGGLILGFSQWLVLRQHCRQLTKQARLNVAWGIASLLSWGIGFVGIEAAFRFSPLIVMSLFLIVGTVIKGFALTKYLKSCGNRHST